MQYNLSYLTTFVEGNVYYVEHWDVVRKLVCEKHGDNSYWFYVNYGYVRATSVLCEIIPNQKLIGSKCVFRETIKYESRYKDFKKKEKYCLFKKLNIHIGKIKAYESFGEYKNQYGITFNSKNKMEWFYPSYWQAREKVDIL